VLTSGHLGRILIPDLRLARHDGEATAAGEIGMTPMREALERRQRRPRITLPFVMLPIFRIVKNSPTYANRNGGAFPSV
jgi:hypothetical protein